MIKLKLQNLIQTADQCVKCGLCLPHCPTYRLFQNENESPRGRISLIQALANQQLEVDDYMRSSLGHCLNCGACESACPSEVEYGVLINSARQILKNKPVPWYLDKMIRYGYHDFNTNLVKKAIWFFQKTPLHKWFAATKLGDSPINDLMPEDVTASPLKMTYPNQVDFVGKVALFTGCFGYLFDTGTLHAAIQLLTQLGYEVDIPENQICCGSLHYHAGDYETAASFAKRNVQAFQQEDYDAVIITASGCGALLKKYATLFAETGVESFSAKVEDICSFISRQSQYHSLKFKPIEETVLLHTPCTLRNSLQQHQAAASLLQQICLKPLHYFSDDGVCCGSAGGYMLEYKEIAEQLRAQKIADLTQFKPDVIATSNIGCSIHLQAGIRQAGQHIKVKHPIALLAEQLELK